MSEHNPVRVSWENVAAFRLFRHHLSRRAPVSALASVAADMAGAQAQALSARQISLWSRGKGVGIRGVDSARWKDHSLVGAWGMRGTMLFVPSAELAAFFQAIGSGAR